MNVRVEIELLDDYERKLFEALVNHIDAYRGKTAVEQLHERMDYAAERTAQILGETDGR